MKSKTFNLIILILIVVFVILSATALIWVARNTPEAKKQNSLSSCADLGNSVVSLGEADAVAKITQNSKPYRIVERDGSTYPQTMDFSPDRLNLAISQGKVVSFTCN